MVVIAERGVQTAGLAVTGFPGGGTTHTAREVEPRAAAPGTRAGDWYADAVLTAMRLRSRRPDSRSVMVLPDFPRYQNLYADTRRPLTASGSRSGGSSHVSQG